jgi:hypothetical protein
MTWSQWLATGPVGFVARPAYQGVEYVRWRNGRRAGPAPHLLKRRILKTYARRYGLDTLVETGTYLGDMVAGVRRDFKSIQTIELDDALYERARRRFAGDANVHLYKGDSGKVLKQIVSELHGPALFWLDAHHSGGITALGDQATPVLEELDHVLASGEPRHVVLIDDARDFNGAGGYPTVDDLRRQIGARPLSLEVKDDVIRIVPAERG